MNCNNCPLKVSDPRKCPFLTIDGCAYKPVKVTQELSYKVMQNNYGEMRDTGERVS